MNDMSSPAEFDHEEIREAERHLIGALEDQDTMQRVYCYAEDAALAMAGTPPIEGQDAFLARAKSGSPLLSLRVDPIVTEGVKDLAYVRSLRPKSR